MKYLFILGRNPELSIAELKGIFGNFEFRRKGNAIIADLDVNMSKDFINRLGGIISIGKVLAEGNDFESQVHSIMLYHGTKNSMNYVLWDFSGDEFYKRVQNYLKKRFHEEKLRATEKTISGKMELQSGESALYVPNGKLIDEQFFVFGNHFGRIFETCDYDEIERRDMGKPVRRESLAISPRLAKIMINLSGVKQGETLLDPFCGVGVILQEALLQEIKVIGIDKDPEAVRAATRNIKHLRINENNFQLIISDASKAKINPMDVIVTEPALGETVKKTQLTDTARRTLRKYEGMMTSVLNNLKKSVSGRIVFTAPYIKVPGKKRLGCDIGRIISQTGLELCKGFPIPEFRKNQIVGREIFVLEKG